jgi:hypothetical protein
MPGSDTRIELTCNRRIELTCTCQNAVSQLARKLRSSTFGLPRHIVECTPGTSFMLLRLHLFGVLCAVLCAGRRAVSLWDVRAASACEENSGEKHKPALKKLETGKREAGELLRISAEIPPQWAARLWWAGCTMQAATSCRPAFTDHSVSARHGSTEGNCACDVVVSCVSQFGINSSCRRGCLPVRRCELVVLPLCGGGVKRPLRELSRISSSPTIHRFCGTMLRGSARDMLWMGGGM